MYFHSLIFRVNSLLCFVDDAVEGLVKSFENSDEDPSVICDELSFAADYCLEWMDLGLLLWLFHIKNE